MTPPLFVLLPSSRKLNAVSISDKNKIDFIGNAE